MTGASATTTILMMANTVYTLGMQFWQDTPVELVTDTGIDFLGTQITDVATADLRIEFFQLSGPSALIIEGTQFEQTNIAGELWYVAYIQREQTLLLAGGSGTYEVSLKQTIPDQGDKYIPLFHGRYVCSEEQYVEVS